MIKYLKQYILAVCVYLKNIHVLSILKRSCMYTYR